MLTFSFSCEGQTSTLKVSLITRLTITHIHTKSHQLISSFQLLCGQTDTQTHMEKRETKHWT